MQKSKKTTIFFLILILIYGLLANFKLKIDFNTLYIRIINPIFWLFLMIFLKLFFGNTSENRKLKKEIISYTEIASLSFIIVYLVSGIFVTFGKNPYNTSVNGIAYNLCFLGSVVIAKEYVRFKLINNVYDKDKNTIAILTAIVYVVMDIEFARLIHNLTLPFMIKYLCQSILPSIAINTVFSYTALNSNMHPAIIYQLSTRLFYWISPILPNSPWVMNSIIEITIPIILFLYIRYTKNKFDRFRIRENLINSDPKSIIPLIILIILAIWFALGIFPIKPIAIASKSMTPKISLGDLAIIKKCNANDILEGDIIEYKLEKTSVIHRVVAKKQRNGDFYFVTKGDNNKTPDEKEVTEEQLVGKVIFKIKYLGFPAIWMTELQTEEEIAPVETGD